MAAEAFVSRAKQVVVENLLNPQFGVSSLAGKLGVSRSELYRRIKETEQKSASQFIREIRLDRALELLKTDRYSISEIAYLVGFNSPTYFSTCFREYFGYSPSTADQNGNTSPDPSVFKSNVSRKWTVPIILGIIAILITVYGISSKGTNNAPEQKISLAVLKFDYLGTDSTQSFMAEVLADEVVNSVSNIAGINVIASSSSFQVNKNEKCTEIGKRLGVDYLVDGSLSNSGNQITAKVKLIETKTGFQLWARSFDASSEVFPNFHEDVSENVYSQIEQSLLSGNKRTRDIRRSTNLEATELYLKAKKLGDERYEESILQAIQWLERAVELDPNFAEAYAELSFLYGQLHFYGSISLEERNKVMSKNLQKALELNPRSPEALFAKADFRFKTGQFPRDSSAIVTGLKELHRAYPDNARYCYRLSQVHRTMGQYDTSHMYLEKAVNLEPENSFYRTILARDLFWKRKQKKRAFSLIEEVTKQESPHNSSYCFKAAMLADQPEYGYLPAMKLIQEALDEEPFSDWYLFWGFRLALDLDLIPLAKKYCNKYEMQYPENPIYSYGSLIKLYFAEHRFEDATDLTYIWLNENRLNPKIAAANKARVHYLQGNYQKSLEVLQTDFPEFLGKNEREMLETGGIQLGDVEPIRTYCEVMRAIGEESRAIDHVEVLCAFYSEHGSQTNFGSKMFPLDCLYLQGDLQGFLQRLEEVFFVKGEQFRIYTHLKTLRYREFEQFPEYLELYGRIEAEIHRQRGEVIEYLKQEGDWDPSWDAALQ